MIKNHSQLLFVIYENRISTHLSGREHLHFFKKIFKKSVSDFCDDNGHVTLFSLKSVTLLERIWK